MDRFAAVTEIMKIQVHDLCLSGWPCENLVVICPSKTQLDCGQKLSFLLILEASSLLSSWVGVDTICANTE